MRISFRSQLSTSILVLFAVALLVVGCGGGDTKKSSGSDDDSGSEATSVDDGVASRDGKYDAPPTLKLDPKRPYVVTLETTEGSFDIKVDPKRAPIAAANFVFLVQEGYYDGIGFHRVIKNFMVQGGDPTGTGMGGPGYTLKDDPITGTYARGTVAMANAGPNTGGSQFFIVQGPDGEQLPKQYVAFGTVDAAGMKVVDAIANVEVEMANDPVPSAPVEPVTITKATLK
ncbi:MAG: peptidylprolyl isomerase [Thermoleophilia bacterium]|nr:peptidylprolyl isomerase [Thermoleophilia bacterium]